MNQISYSGPDSEIQIEIQNKVELLSKIADVAKQDNHINILFEQFLDALIEMTNLDSGIVKLLDPHHTFFLQSETFHGISQKFLEKSAGNPIGGCLCSVAMAQKSIAYTADIARDRRFSCPLCKSENFKFVICIPITCQNESIGVIQLASHKIVKIKPADLALMESAGKIISNAMEYHKLVKSNNYNKQTNSICLNILNDVILTVGTDMKIIDVSEYALKILDIPKENIINNPISSILPDNIVKQLPILAESKTSIKTNIGSKTKIESQLKVYPVIDETTGDYTHYLISLEITKQNSIQERFDSSTKHMSDFMEILSNIDIKKNVQDFCDSAMSKIDSLLPVIQSTYLIYYYDKLEKELQLIANSGFSNEFIQEHVIISSENYEYKNVLNTKQMYSIYKEDIGWKIIIPLVYSGESKGIMVLLSENELKDSLEEKEIFYAIGSLVAVILEKQALYDSLENTSKIINEINSSPSIISNAIIAPSTSATERIKKLFEAALSITKCQTVTLTIKKGSEAKKYYLQEGSELKMLTSEIIPNSREAYVLENGEYIYRPSLNENETEFAGDEELKYKFTAVIPVIISNLIIAVMTFESNEINQNFPEDQVNLIANLILSNITTQQNKQKVKKLTEEKIALETNLETMKKSLSKQDAQRIEILKKTIDKIESEKKALESEKIQLNEKVKIALENEEKQKQIANKSQRIIEEAKKQFKEKAEELKKNIIGLRTELKNEKENNEAIKQELQEVIEEGIKTKIALENNSTSPKIIEEYKQKIKEVETNSENKQKEFEKQIEDLKAESEQKIKEIEANSESKQKEFEKQIEDLKAESEQKIKENETNSENKQKEFEKQIEDLKAESEQKIKEVETNSENKQKEFEKQIEDLKAESEQKIKENENRFEEEKIAITSKYDEELKQKELEKENIKSEYEKQLNEVKQELADDNEKTATIKEAEEKIAILEKRSEDTIILSEEKIKKFLAVLSVQTKEIMQATDIQTIKNIVNETGKILYKDYQDIQSENIDDFTKEIFDKKYLFKEKEYSIRLIWNSVTDTAIRRLEEITYISKIKDLIKIAK